MLASIQNLMKLSFRKNGFKLKVERFRFDVRRKFLTWRAVRHCYKLPREAAEKLAVFPKGWY